MQRSHKWADDDESGPLRCHKARLKVPRLSGSARKVKNNGLCIVYQWLNMYTDW